MDSARHLDVLDLSEMPEWETSPDPQRDVGDHHPPFFFPRLRQLSITYCPKLRELPPLPPTLQRLELLMVGLTSVPGMWGCLGGREDSEGTSSTSHALTYVRISGCPNLTSVSGLLQHHLTALEELEITNCKELLSLTGREALGHLLSLKHLNIQDCPKLMTCPPPVQEDDQSLPLPLPPSLERFRFVDCGNVVGGWWLAGLQHLTSLSHLTLAGCPTTVTSLFLSLARDRHHPLAETLTDLEIRDCRSNYPQASSPSSSSSPPPSPPAPPERPEAGVFRVLTSLKKLRIRKSNNLLQVWRIGGLPLSLEFLHIDGDDDLDDGCLATWLRDLTSLQGLSISGWSATFLPAGLLGLTSLKMLSISHFPRITCLPATLTELSSLESLRIESCPKVESLAEMGLPASLRELEISYCPALTSLPGRVAEDHCSQMTALLSVSIDGCRELTSLGGFLHQAPFLRRLTLCGCEKLCSLPATLNGLSSLGALCIHSCPEIESLPEMGLPASLRLLQIIDCPSLKERCRDQGSPDWSKISHIPHVLTD